MIEVGFYIFFIALFFVFGVIISCLFYDSRIIFLGILSIVLGIIVAVFVFSKDNARKYIVSEIQEVKFHNNTAYIIYNNKFINLNSLCLENFNQNEKVVILTQELCVDGIKFNDSKFKIERQK